MSVENPTLPVPVTRSEVGRGLVGDYVGQGSQFWGLYAREILKTFRNPLIILITLVQPFMWLAFFGSSFANVPLSQLKLFLCGPTNTACLAAVTSYIQFLLPGILATSMLTIGMFGSMSTIQDKRFGFMKRILLTPTSRSTVYLAKSLGSATRGMVQIPVMLAAAYAFGVRFGAPAWMWLGWMAGLVCLGFGFSAFFLAVTASSTDWQTPGVISNFITLPLMFASGALFPVENYPTWMQVIAAWNPVAYAALLGRGVVVYETFNPFYLGVLALFAAVMMVIGTLVARRYLKAE